MRRYVLTALLAELICSSLFFVGPRKQERQCAIYNAEPRQGLISWENPRRQDKWTHKEVVLDRQAQDLAFQLDLLDDAPILIGFPAIAVLALWTIDRRRKQKTGT
jgi:hypothetical protein